MPDAISTLALATGGAFLGKFVGPAAEHMGKLALERAQQLGAKATALLGSVGREPQPVEPKLLVPLVQAASLESDSTLAEKWAALLANAADPTQRVQVQPGFSEILRQLTQTEALFAIAIGNSTLNESSATKRTSLFQNTYAYRHINGASDEDFAVAIDNLVRLGLATTRGPIPQEAVIQVLGGPEVGATEVLPGKERIAMTYLGLAFLAAVTPPTL